MNKFNNEVWLSLVERCVRDAEAAGSNPVTSTICRKSRCISGFLFFIPEKIPSHSAGDFSYRSVIPPLRKKSR